MSTTTETGTTAPNDAERTAAQDAHEPEAGTDPTPKQRDDEQPQVSANGEAARRRRQLREVEAERDGLREQLAAAQRREVDRLAGAHLAVAGDLFDVGGVDLAELVDKHGAVDEQAVLAAATALLAARPGLGVGLARRTAPPNHGAGYRSPVTPTSSWSDLLKGKGV